MKPISGPLESGSESTRNRDQVGEMALVEVDSKSADKVIVRHPNEAHVSPQSWRAKCTSNLKAIQAAVLLALVQWSQSSSGIRAFLLEGETASRG